MPKGPRRTVGAARLLAHSESQPTRREPRRVLVPGHQPGRLRLDDLTVGPQELAQEPGDIGCRGVGPTPGGAQLPPVRAVPVPLPRMRVAAPRFGRGTLHLARDHLIQLVSPQSLGRVLHAQRLEYGAGDELEDARPAEPLADLRGEQDSHARVLVAGTGGKSEGGVHRLPGELRKRRMTLAQLV